MTLWFEVRDTIVDIALVTFFDGNAAEFCDYGYSIAVNAA